MTRKKKDGTEDSQLDLTEGENHEDQESEEGSKNQEESGSEEGQGDGQAESPQEVIEKLKKQLEDREAEVKSERERASKAEKEQAESQKKATTAAEDALNAHETAVTTALGHINTEIDMLEAQLEAALESGAAKEVVAINRKIGVAINKSQQLENQKTQIATYKESEKKRAETQAQAPQLTDAQRQWLRDHPKYETDPDYRADTQAADYAARARGLSPGSSSYVKFLDNYLERLHPEESDERAPRREAEQRPNRSVTSFAAPAGRSMPSQTNETKKPKLTDQQKAHCKEMGWDEKSYLENLEKAKIRKQGR